MANQYKSFYLKDLEDLINTTAMDCMMTPVLERKKIDGTAMSMSELANYNSLVATNNEGIRDFVLRLKAELEKEDEDSDS